jgi:hypothetical protein
MESDHELSLACPDDGFLCLDVGCSASPASPASFMAHGLMRLSGGWMDGWSMFSRPPIRLVGVRWMDGR